jgi:hypothetical protein
MNIKNKDLTQPKLIAIALTTLSLFLTVTPASARYLPPANQKPPSDRSKSTGIRRDCPQITLLAPKTHVGQTTLTQPTFAWVVASAPTSNAAGVSTVKFKIGEISPNAPPQQIGKDFDLPLTPGIMTLSLSKDQLSLQVGRTYLWQVSIRCPDGGLVQRAEIEVVELPTRLKQDLLTVKDAAERVDRYGEVGFWYDALAIAIANPQPKNLETRLIQSLIQVESDQLERLPTTEPDAYRLNLRQHIERLKEITNLKPIAN